MGLVGFCIFILVFKFFIYQQDKMLVFVDNHWFKSLPENLAKMFAKLIIK